MFLYAPVLVLALGIGIGIGQYYWVLGALFGIVLTLIMSYLYCTYLCSVLQLFSLLPVNVIYNIVVFLNKLIGTKSSKSIVRVHSVSQRPNMRLKLINCKRYKNRFTVDVLLLPSSDHC